MLVSILETCIFSPFISVYHSNSHNFFQVYVDRNAFFLFHLGTWNNIWTRNSQTDRLTAYNLKLGRVAAQNLQMARLVKSFCLELAVLKLTNTQLESYVLGLPSVFIPFVLLKLLKTFKTDPHIFIWYPKSSITPFYTNNNFLKVTMRLKRHPTNPSQIFF